MQIWQFSVNTITCVDFPIENHMSILDLYAPTSKWRKEGLWWGGFFFFSFIFMADSIWPFFQESCASLMNN